MFHRNKILLGAPLGRQLIEGDDGTRFDKQAIAAALAHGTHAPLMQDALGPHALPHEPQLLSSLPRSTHAPPQSVEHATHAPPVQD